MWTRADGLLTKTRASSLNALIRHMIRLDLKFEQAFVLVLENILGPSAVAHNRNSTTYYHHQSQQCPDGQMI